MLIGMIQKFAHYIKALKQVERDSAKFTRECLVSKIIWICIQFHPSYVGTDIHDDDWKRREVHLPTVRADWTRHPVFPPTLWYDGWNPYKRKQPKDRSVLQPRIHSQWINIHSRLCEAQPFTRTQSPLQTPSPFNYYSITAPPLTSRHQPSIICNWLLKPREVTP